MLIFDSHRGSTNLETDMLARYMAGEKVVMDGEFKEEDHPRGGEGSGKGGQFVKSEKTKQKEDAVDDLQASNAPTKQNEDDSLTDKQKKDIDDIMHNRDYNINSTKKWEQKEHQIDLMYHGGKNKKRIEDKFANIREIMKNLKKIIIL